MRVARDRKTIKNTRPVGNVSRKTHENKKGIIASSLHDAKGARSASASPPPAAGIKTLIIGYGNPLRSDDGLGWHAARLAQKALADRNVEVITCQQLTPELAETLSQYRRAVFIDADAEGESGEIRIRPLNAQDSVAVPFTHSCTPEGLIASARSLYGRSPSRL